MLKNAIDQVLKVGSRINLRGPFEAEKVSDTDVAGFLKAQKLAENAVAEVSTHLKAGMTEIQVADLLNAWLKDHGVQAFFHLAYVWFGERTRFNHIDRKKYKQFMPSRRVLKEGESFILDIAPIVDGFVCDIGYSGHFGENAEHESMMRFLTDLRRDIPNIVKQSGDGREIWKAVDQIILRAGYENIHEKYPFHVLGHRVHKTANNDLNFNLMNFGLLSYASLMSRGVFSQLMSEKFSGDLNGLWAIEPHIAKGDMGAKFEEILLIDGDRVEWIDSEVKLWEVSSGS